MADDDPDTPVDPAGTNPDADPDDAFEAHPAPDHWTDDGAPQDGATGLIRIRSDDATTEEVVFPDGTVQERDRTVLDEAPYDDGINTDPADNGGPLTATQWVSTDVPRKPLWTPNQAVAQARRQPTTDTCPHYSGYGGLCLHFVACMYGFASSGTYDAASFWRLMPDRYCHYEDRTPPVGALVCWYGGSAGHGHISIVVAPGMIASNDIRRYGRIDIVPLGEISARWGQDYKGWTPPYFARGVGTNGQQPPIAPSGGGPDRSKWDSGPVYVEKLHQGQRGSDSVRRLKYRLIHHADMPLHFKNDLDFDGHYGPRLVAAVRHWQRNIYRPLDKEHDDGMELSHQQANRLFGDKYRVIGARARNRR